MTAKVSLSMDILPVLTEAKSYIQHNEQQNHANENDPLVRKLDRVIKLVLEEMKNGL